MGCDITILSRHNLNITSVATLADNLANRLGFSIDYGYYHGYALMDKEGLTPRFAFGHGLSYAKFAYRALKVRVASDAVEVSIAVRNNGPMNAASTSRV